MKLEVGKIYNTRNGKNIVSIIDKSNSGKFLGSDGITRRSSGQFTDRKKYDDDLVSEVELK